MDLFGGIFLGASILPISCPSTRLYTPPDSRSFCPSQLPFQSPSHAHATHAAPAPAAAAAASPAAAPAPKFTRQIKMYRNY